MGYDKLDELCINTIRTLAVCIALTETAESSRWGVEEDEEMPIGAILREQWLTP